MPVPQGLSSHPPESPVRSLASLVVLVALLSAVLIYDHSLLEQIQGFLGSGWPDFAATTRLLAYLITTLVLLRLIHKYRGWMIACASALSFLLVAFWLR